MQEIICMSRGLFAIDRSNAKNSAGFAFHPAVNLLASSIVSGRFEELQSLFWIAASLT
jgi:hypothetical protein